MAPVLAVYLGLAIALVYLPMTGAGESWLRSGVKTLPLLLFTLAAGMMDAAPFLMGALFLSALGDLALSRRGNKAFLFGLASFALAHLVYTLHFLSLSGREIWEAFALAPLIAVLVLGLSLSAELWLSPHTGPLRWPVRFYIVLITAMGLSALTLPLGAVALGAALFILSDLLLSLQLFRMGEDNPLVGPTGWAIWAFYVLGQALILTGAGG